EIVAMIERLEERGYAYVAGSGDVCYRVRRFERYGALSGEDPDELRSGARIEASGDKEDPLDFVL
ncbi:MAG: cysteine--tRNA ligase, partial [Gammaproteobacteria bacterium]|nr:cysteine--tRNA ligase [Gammaproteobacteria bacterium]